MVTTTKPTGLAGPIVLLYLGYVASVPYSVAIVRNIGNPDVSFDGALPFGLLAVVGFGAFVSAIRMLADNSKFRGFVVHDASTLFHKLTAVTVTAVVMVATVGSLFGGSPALGLLAPLAIAWSAVNAMRLYRSLK